MEFVCILARQGVFGTFIPSELKHPQKTQIQWIQWLKPDRETRTNTCAYFYLLCIHMCIFLFALHPSSVSLHLPLGNRDQLVLPGILCAHPPDEVLQCMVHLRLWHLRALQGSPGLWGPTHSLDNTRTSHCHSVLSYKKQKQGHLDGA